MAYVVPKRTCASVYQRSAPCCKRLIDATQTGRQHCGTTFLVLVIHEGQSVLNDVQHAQIYIGEDLTQLQEQIMDMTGSIVEARLPPGNSLETRLQP